MSPYCRPFTIPPAGSFNGATDLFVNDRHGKIIDTPEDIKALAESLDYFTNAENIEKASRAIGDDNLQEKISIGRAAGELADLYKTILDERGR